MQNTTLGYMEKDGCWLMLHRTKKKNDISHDKWLGIGGKMEDGETVLECMQRETLEETGLIWKDPQLKGIITFNFYEEKNCPVYSELMFLFSGGTFEGQMKECEEGSLEWVPIDEVFKLPLWEGDFLFLDKLRNPGEPLFYMNLTYLQDRLMEASCNGRSLISQII
ncbi:MAG: 8-oxo-dGTP diphosphatase [Erysipelotrichaceae bacterium]|nr:8-oxo-dGTP diphosphatase [Erysipelotrichaceae bacterium]